MNSDSSSKAKPYVNPEKGKGAATKTEPAVAVARTESEKAPVFREVVESFAVALVLALLFRAFVAEAFVIPTGSMAPTLMGAHKDVRCPECGFDYQCGASSEFDELQKHNGVIVRETVCPLCRHQQELDLENNANHRTFAGDKILVSRFAYFWNQPKRWDVFVFKNPSQARQNYIKRLTGTPSEKLEIRHGNVYVKPLESQDAPTIARKPPRVIGAMLQPLYDSQHLSKSLVKAGLPSSFQPFPAKAEVGWKVEQAAGKWQAECDALQAKDSPVWLRYFHRVVDRRIWKEVLRDGKLPKEWDPYDVRLITDFTHYNAAVTERSDRMYSASEDPCFENDGWNWVADLAAEYDIEVQSSAGNLVLDCVECGVHHQCSIDVATGVATFRQYRDGKLMQGFVKEGSFVSEATAQTSLRGAGSYRLRMANIDDQLHLWVNGRSQTFEPSGAYDTTQLLPASEEFPHWGPSDPLDGAPVGIGIRELKAKVTRTRVWRDIYYIATYGNGNITDYNNLNNVIPRNLNEEPAVNDYLARIHPERKFDRFPKDEEKFSLWRDTVYSSPQLWSSSRLLKDRRTVQFELLEHQYFPMGDNSLQSFDARAWRVPHVPERLILGKAVLVLWPHYWNRPIPFVPNVARMGLIR